MGTPSKLSWSVTVWCLVVSLFVIEILWLLYVFQNTLAQPRRKGVVLIGISCCSSNNKLKTWDRKHRKTEETLMWTNLWETTTYATNWLENSNSKWLVKMNKGQQRSAGLRWIASSGRLLTFLSFMWRLNWSSFRTPATIPDILPRVSCTKCSPMSKFVLHLESGVISAFCEVCVHICDVGHQVVAFLCVDRICVFCDTERIRGEG